MTNKIAHVPFVLGGRILDRSYPMVLEPNPKASARRNRTLSHEEWDEFCDEFESAMSWAHNWPHCFLNRAVVISFSSWFASVVLLIITREEDHIRRRRREHQNATEEGGGSSNHTHSGFFHIDSYDNQQPHSLLSQEILPDICVLLLLVFAVTMAMAMIQMSFQLQDSISAVCDEYNHRYSDFCGVKFEVQKKPTIASPPWRAHSTKHVRHNRRSDFRSYILVSKISEDATSCYQNASPPAFSTAKQMQFSRHPQHPNDELGVPPFFDVVRVPVLLPPQAHMSNGNKGMSQYQQRTTE